MAKKKVRGASSKRAGPPSSTSGRDSRLTVFLSGAQRTVFASAAARDVVDKRVPTTVLRLALRGLEVTHPDLFAQLVDPKGVQPPKAVNE